MTAETAQATAHSTIISALFHQADVHHDKPALRRKERNLWMDMSWSQYKLRTLQAAAGLQVIGVEPGSKVAILEDTSTTGGSLLTAVERAEAAGLEVVQCITVVDRLDGAGEAVAAAGHTLESIVTRIDLVG